MSKLRPTLWQRIKQLFSPVDSTPSAEVAASPVLLTNNSANGNAQSIDSRDLPKLENATQSGTDKTREQHDEPIVVIGSEDAMTTEKLSDFPPKWLLESPIMVSDIEAMLEQLGYQFVYHPVQSEDEQQVHHFTMQVSDKEHEWGCMVRYLGEQQLMAVYSILPFSVPESHRADMLAVISYLNYDLVIGNLEMDLHDGELRFKTSLDLEVTGVTEMALSYLLQSNFSLVSRLYTTLEEVIKKPQPAANLNQAVDQLINTQQEKTFYLMTEAIQ